MRGFGLAACLAVLAAAPAAAQDYQDDDDYGAPSQDEGRWDDGPRDDRGWNPAAVRSEDQAVDACAVAAENQGREYAATARVVDITDVDRDARGWIVEGTVELRQGWRERGREERFRCAVTYQGLRDVRIDRLDRDWR